MRLCKHFDERNGHCKILSEQTNQWTVCPIGPNMSAQALCQTYQAEPSWKTFERIKNDISNVHVDIQTLQYQMEHVERKCVLMDKLECDLKGVQRTVTSSNNKCTVAYILAGISVAIATLAFLW